MFKLELKRILHSSAKKLKAAATIAGIALTYTFLYHDQPLSYF